jgi:hypothetical protein
MTGVDLQFALQPAAIFDTRRMFDGLSRGIGGVQGP